VCGSPRGPEVEGSAECSVNWIRVAPAIDQNQAACASSPPPPPPSSSSSPSPIMIERWRHVLCNTDDDCFACSIGGSLGRRAVGAPLPGRRFSFGLPPP
jgi:hypothetical protein